MMKSVTYKRMHMTYWNTSLNMLNLHQYFLLQIQLMIHMLLHWHFDIIFYLIKITTNNYFQLKLNSHGNVYAKNISPKIKLRNMNHEHSEVTTHNSNLRHQFQITIHSNENYSVTLPLITWPRPIWKVKGFSPGSLVL